MSRNYLEKEIERMDQEGTLSGNTAWSAGARRVRWREAGKALKADHERGPVTHAGTSALI